MPLGHQKTSKTMNYSMNTKLSCRHAAQICCNFCNTQRQPPRSSPRFVVVGWQIFCLKKGMRLRARVSFTFWLRLKKGTNFHRRIRSPRSLHAPPLCQLLLKLKNTQFVLFHRDECYRAEQRKEEAACIFCTTRCGMEDTVRKLIPTIYGGWI
jgi:hypothetical protein